MVATELTDEQIADMVHADRAARTPSGGAFNRTDKAILAVAKGLDLNWRRVLKAYRSKYPLSAAGKEKMDRLFPGRSLSR